MANQEMGQRVPEEDKPEQMEQKDYSIEQSKKDLENDMKELQEKKIALEEFMRRRREAIEKIAELKKSSTGETEEIGKRLKKAVGNFNDIVNKKI
jgi:hypothetical protein